MTLDVVMFAQKFNNSDERGVVFLLSLNGGFLCFANLLLRTFRAYSQCIHWNNSFQKGGGKLSGVSRGSGIPAASKPITAGLALGQICGSVFANKLASLPIKL